jgi:hypothetical protein
MKEYLDAYAAYAQDPGTTYRMHDYYAPDFQIVHFIAGVKTITGRDNFLHLMSAHPSSYEKLVAEDITVDDRRNVAVMLLKTEITDKTTGKVAVIKHYLVHYQLIVDDNNTLKIKDIKLFDERLAPGVTDVGDIFMKDPEMANLFGD